MSEISRSECFTVVDLNGAHASIQFSEFEDMQFRRELLDRSSLLRQALSDVQDDSEMTLAVPQVFLHSWLQWRTNENIWDSNFVDRGPQIVKFLEAADYLGDEEGCGKLCRQAAQGMLPQPPNCSPISTSDSQVLEALPSSLLGAILAECQAPLSHLLAVLPPHLHTPALHAAYPTIEAEQTIHVSVRDACAANALSRRFWSLLNQLTTLQHLSLDMTKAPIRVHLQCPGPLAGLIHLTFLKVSGAKLPLGGHGWDIGHLVELLHLDLANSALQHEHMQLLAPQLMHLTKLEYLDVSENCFEEAVAEVLAQYLPQLRHLQHLDLSSDATDIEGMSTLAPQITTLSHLTCLNPKKTRYYSRDACIFLNELLVNLPTLKHLHCVYGTLGQLIVPHLDTFTGLQSFEVGVMFQGQVLHNELPQQIACMTRLTQLKLSHIEEGTGCQRWGRFMSKLAALQELHVMYSYLNCHCIDLIRQHIIPLTSMQALHLHDIHVSASDMPGAVKQLQMLPCVHLSMIAENWEGPLKDTTAYAAALGGLTALTYLDFVHWPADAIHAEQVTQIWEALAHTLSSLKHLQHFVLRSCFDDDGLKTLAASVGVLTDLRELNIDSTHVGETGVVDLSKHVADLTKLSIFRLSVHSLGDEGCTALIASLKKLPALRRLLIEHCKLEEGHVKALMDFFSRRGLLQCIQLGEIDATVERVVSQYERESHFVAGLSAGPCMECPV